MSITKARRPTRKAKAKAILSRHSSLPKGKQPVSATSHAPYRRLRMSPAHAAPAGHGNERAIEKQVGLALKALRSRRLDLLPTSIVAEVIRLHAALLEPVQPPLDLARELRRELRQARSSALAVTGDRTDRAPLCDLLAASGLACPLCGASIAESKVRA